MSNLLLSLDGLVDVAIAFGLFVSLYIENYVWKAFQWSPLPRLVKVLEQLVIRRYDYRGSF